MDQEFESIEITPKLLIGISLLYFYLFTINDADAEVASLYTRIL